MKKNVTILIVLSFIFFFVGCKQTENKTKNQSIELVEIYLGRANLLSEKEIEIDEIPQILRVEANVEIAKATVEVIAENSSLFKSERVVSSKKFTQSIEDFREGENIVKIVVETEDGKAKDFSKKIIYKPNPLRAVVYIDEECNKVKSKNQLITIKENTAKVFVVARHPLISATLDDGSIHEMNIDRTNETTQKTANFEVSISSTEKTISIKARAKGYHEFSINFRLVQGEPPVNVVKATFNDEEFQFNNKNLATIDNPEINFNLGILLLEFNKKEELKVDILSTTYGYVQEVVEGSGLPDDVGESRKLEFIADNRFTLQVITLGKYTEVKLKAIAKDCVETEYTIQINRKEKVAFPASSDYAARNAYSNQETAFTDKGFVWPYVSADNDATYLYKTMGDLIATNFEFDGPEMEYYVFTRLKDKAEGNKKDGAWVKWGPSQYVEDWRSSILNVRLSSQDKFEFMLDGFVGTKYYEACPMVSAPFKRVAKGGLVLDAYSIQGNAVEKNMAFARTQRFYNRMLYAFDVSKPEGLKIKARDNHLTAEYDYFVGYWTSTKEIEKVECTISMQDKPEDTPTPTSWNRMHVQHVSATETKFARIHFAKKATSTFERFVFQGAKIYTIELFIKVKGEAEEIKGKYVINYRYK